MIVRSVASSEQTFRPDRRYTLLRMSLDAADYRDLEGVAKKKGITIQELIRAIILPEWVESMEQQKRASQ